MRMDTLLDNLPTILKGFRETLLLLVFSGVLATALGTILASMRVSPIPVLRAFGTSYVNVLRNTPLLLVLLIMLFGMPEIGVSFDVDLGFRTFNSFFVFAVMGLSIYTAAFVCEVLRSGVNAVDAGQAEAARAIGMTFGQTLGLIVLPQAFRTAIPPLANVYIALAKNTSLALAAGVTEATFQMRKLVNAHTSDLYVLFIGFALGYCIIVWVISAISHLLERSQAVTR
jgi:glutamate transport system permease protein